MTRTPAGAVTVLHMVYAAMPSPLAMCSTVITRMSMTPLLSMARTRRGVGELVELPGEAEPVLDR